MSVLAYQASKWLAVLPVVADAFVVHPEGLARPGDDAQVHGAQPLQGYAGHQVAMITSLVVRVDDAENEIPGNLNSARI
jgi:hypothetical protein